MTVGIVGLGLIGGSFARVYGAAGHTVLVLDKDPEVLSMAREAGAAHGELTRENAGNCDLVLVCLYPQASIRFLEDFGPFFGKKPVVLDSCGTKRKLVRAGAEASRKFGFTFLGGHPMAGTQYSGFAHSRANMFSGAPMVLVPTGRISLRLLSHVRALLSPVGFGSIMVTSADHHDEMIAFTSQLAHVVSNAYVKSPCARNHKGFSAGSYRDLTRVAWLNPEMWAELFLDNRDKLIREIDLLTGHLQEYRNAMAREDESELIRLLLEGKTRKEELDG